MKRLQWWFRIVGLFYLLLGIGFFPPLNEARLPLMLSIDVSTSSAESGKSSDRSFRES